MRGLNIRTAVVQVILTTAFSFSAAAATLNDLAWLSGCWHSDGDEQQTAEYWMQPAGNNMLGLSHTTKERRTLQFEFMRIVQEMNGEIFFVAMPSGQKEARFKLTMASEREVRFENPAHDFPQRIIYRRAGDSLIGRIEGNSKGQEKAIDFPLKRVACGD